MRPKKFWIAAISKEHTQRGVQGNFLQVCHGKQAPLKRMQKGDGVLVYSSKLQMEGKEKCQSFTAIGEVMDDKVYLFEMSESFHPFRRNIQFFACKECSIIPLIPELDFIQNKKSWGYPFRFGFLEIPEKDFQLVRSQMLVP